MNNYFYKFDSGLALDPSLVQFKGDNSFNFLSGEGAISYSKVNNIVELARKHFARKIFGIEPHLIYYAEVHGPLLDPHRDHGSTTVANFYFESCDAVTSFYEPKESAQTINYGGSASVQDSNIYRLEDLNLVGEFQAQDGDSYLLDVSKIHSVKFTRPGVRRFINMQWYGIDIDTVYRSILKN